MKVDHLSADCMFADINMLRISLDAQIEELEQHFETAHLNYLQQTAQRTHDFKELTQNDQRLSQDIDQKRKKIDSLQVSWHFFPPIALSLLYHDLSWHGFRRRFNNGERK